MTHDFKAPFLARKKVARKHFMYKNVLKYRFENRQTTEEEEEASILKLSTMCNPDKNLRRR